MTSHVRSTLARAGALLAAAALVAAATPDFREMAADAGTAGTAPVTEVLPFDMPPVSALRSSPKKVFAHYLASLPVSLDNRDPASDYYARHYLQPEGENAKHAAYGGFLRDRPATRPPLTATNWRLEDMKTEVRQAIDAGFDGFTFDVLQVHDGSVPQLWANANLMMEAAAAVDPGFKVVLMPDMAGSLATRDVATVAKGMATLGGYSSAYRLADGRLVISPFKAEAHDVAWWTSFMETMKTTYGMPVALLPVFVGHEQNYSSAFAPISYGMSNWGSRNPRHNNPESTAAGSPRARAAAVKSLGQKWMQPVSAQDERPNQGIFDEAENTGNLRATWQLARATDAEFVQFVTWNDYTENTHIAPSAKYGMSYVDLSSYYLTWYKTGSAPTILRDTVYLSHRTQPWAASPSYAQTKLMSLRGGSPARDTVEALTFLTAPATVTISVGDKSYLCAVEAGVDTCTVPLGAGQVSAVVSRLGAVTASVTSKHAVTRTPYVQDLAYTMTSSGRAPAGVAPPPSAPTLVDRVVSAPASADSYANAGAAQTNYGSSSSLSVRGSTAAVSYLRFAVPPAPSGTRLTAAALRVTTTADPAAGTADALTVSTASGSWAESALTWATRPPLTSAAVASIPGGTVPGRSYNASLDPGLVPELAAGGALALTSTGTDEARFWSRNYSGADARPQLVLTYTPVVPGAVAPVPAAPAPTPTATPTPSPTPPTAVAPSPTALAAPTDVTLDVSGSQVTVSWAPSDDVVVRYEVERSSESGAPGTAGLMVEAVTGTRTSARTPPGTWYYRVFAVDAAGSRSPGSTEMNATVTDTSEAPATP